MTSKHKPDLYDPLRLNFGNGSVEPGRLPGPDRRNGRPTRVKAEVSSKAESGRTEPVTVRRANPRAWRVAREVAEGDVRRLEILADGSVLIHNRPMR
ncbi:hypothetical protein H4W34_000190 [Actinomadura algeriensis]|uniref:Uncharacterized protein n=1 Tax=Actinomadura algeriensis TaxID=1679523 RepID=A0ABR9JII1_9ACTN|nr:hypothetical protein [Actinomadura algeriensis]